MSPLDYALPSAAPSARAARWQLRTRTLELPRRPRLMGIVNVTPDSFSDGGLYFTPQAAIDHALRLVDQGADLLDVGGESTRPYAAEVPLDEELRRVMPVVEGLARRGGLCLSIDTSKARVAREAVAAGVEIINDVTALAGDPEMLAVAASSQAAVCLMHMLGTPQTMQDQPHYHDVVSEVAEFLDRRRKAALAAGVARERIALDPGIGFGKSHQHNLDLLAAAATFHRWGAPLVFGHSRKGFIAKVLGRKSADRTAGSLGVALALAQAGVGVLRVHDVEATREALELFEAVGGFDGLPLRLAGQ